MFVWMVREGGDDMTELYPPEGEGAMTVGRPEDGEDAGAAVAAWVKQQLAEWEAEDEEDAG